LFAFYFCLERKTVLQKPCPLDFQLKVAHANSFFMHCSPLMIKKTLKFSFAALAIILISSATSYFAPQSPPSKKKKKKRKKRKGTSCCDHLAVPPHFVAKQSVVFLFIFFLKMF
jgi:hypothetical protein